MGHSKIYPLLLGLGNLIALYSLFTILSGALPCSIEREINNLSRSAIEKKVREMHPFGDIGYHIIAKPGIILDYWVTPEK